MKALVSALKRNGHVHFLFNYFLLAFLIFFLFSTQLDAQEPAWPMSRFNAQNTAQSPYNGPVEQPRITKRVSFSYIVSAPIVISKDGTIYAACLNDTLYALNKNLDILWKRNVDVQIGGWGISYPAIGPSGNVYIFDYNGNHLLALNPNNGSLLWETDYLGDYGRGIPVIGEDETIYIFAGSVLAISQNGSVKWSRQLFNLINQVALSPTGDKIYVSTCPNLAAINHQTGNDIWYRNFYSYSACPHRPAVASDGTIYAACDDSLYAIAPDSRVVWSAYVGAYGKPGWTAIDEIKNQVYVASANDTLYAFSFSGSRLWTAKSEHYFYYQGAPIVGINGIIYMLCKQNTTGDKLKAFHPSDGTVLWTITGSSDEGGDGNAPSSQPVIGADGNIYIGNARGIYVISDKGVSVQESTLSEIPNEIILHQNYPNPSNSTTIINYQLSAVSSVNIAIYDIQGKNVKTLINKTESPGTHSISWDGKNNFGKSVSSGVYFYQLKLDGKYAVGKKLIYLK